MFRNPAIPAFLVLVLSGTPAAATDDPSSIRIEADDRGMVDMEAGHARFTGNVRMTRGELRLTAEEAVLHWSGETLQRAVFTGTPARFEQPATEERSAVSGRAGEIEYFADSGKIVLRGDAVVEEGDRRLEAQRIHYDTRARRMDAGREGDDESRIRITIPADRPDTDDEGKDEPTEGGPQ